MAARRAVTGAVTAAASAATLAAEPADCRAARSDASPSNSIVVSGVSSSWELLPREVDEASLALGNSVEKCCEGALVETESQVASAMMTMAKSLASKPEIQRAILRDLGLDKNKGPLNISSAGEGQGEEEDLDGLVEALRTLEEKNAALVAENAAHKAALQAQASQVDESAKVLKQLHRQNEVLAKGVSSPGNDSATEVDDLFASLETMGRVDSEVAQEEGRDHTECPDGNNKTATSDDDDDGGGGGGGDGTFVEKVLAIAGILVLFALTRKLSPTLVKRAGAISAAAIATIAKKCRNPSY